MMFGWALVKLGTESRLGKIILSCLQRLLGREGLVLAAVMANASSIFFRVGTGEDKLKSDRLKVQFCRYNNELLTLLSVYKKWEKLHMEHDDTLKNVLSKSSLVLYLQGSAVERWRIVTAWKAALLSSAGPFLVEQCDSALESGNGQFPNVPCPKGFWGPYITRFTIEKYEGGNHVESRPGPEMCQRRARP
ncbi:hypothetical protein LguiA_013685 [Lonicera macranthoides]